MREMKFRYLVYLLMFMFLVPSGLGATENEVAQDVFTLGEVVVTSDRETIIKVSTVDTVDASRLAQANVNNVSDALDTLPGVNVSVGTRNEKTFTVRGFNQRYVPVLYDGIPIYIPYDGYVDSGNLPTGNISKITLTKGVSSVLYGPNTMGGVINIVSKKPSKSFEADYKLSVDDNGGKTADVNLGSMLNKFYLSGGVSWLDSDSYNLSGSFDATENEDGDERDNSDIEQVSGSFKAGIVPSDDHEYAVGYSNVSSEKGMPPSTEGRARYWRFAEWEKETYYLIGDSKITDKLSTKVRLYRDTYYNVLDSYDDDTYTTQERRSAFHSTYDDNGIGGSLVVKSEHINNNTLSLGINYKDDEHKAQGDYGEDWERYEAETYSIGLEDDIKHDDQLSSVLGINYDVQKAVYANGGDLRDDITAFNPQLGINYSIDEYVSTHFSVGAKTRFPSIKELYSEYLDRSIPNPDLKPERAINAELGYTMLLGDSKLDANVFYSDIKNLIVTKEIAEDTEQNQNIGKALYTGIELTLLTNISANNQIEMSYTYLDAQNKSPDRTSDYLEETVKHKVYVSDNYHINDIFSLFGKLSYNSKRYYEDSDMGWLTLDGFWTVDAKMLASITRYLSLELGSKNIFDKNYELSYGYPREGRSFFLTLSGKI